MTVSRQVLAIAAALLVLGLSGTARASVSYTYDNQGRVVVATYSNGTSITYTYDLAGNITSRQVACGSGGC